MLWEQGAAGSNPAILTIGSAGTSDYQPSLGPLGVLSIRRLRATSGCKLKPFAGSLHSAKLQSARLDAKRLAGQNMEEPNGVVSDLENREAGNSGVAVQLDPLPPSR